MSGQNEGAKGVTSRISRDAATRWNTVPCGIKHVFFNFDIQKEKGPLTVGYHLSSDVEVESNFDSCGENILLGYRSPLDG